MRVLGRILPGDLCHRSLRRRCNVRGHRHRLRMHLRHWIRRRHPDNGAEETMKTVQTYTENGETTTPQDKEGGSNAPAAAFGRSGGGRSPSRLAYHV